MAGVIVDTGVLIRGERSRTGLQSLLPPASDVVVAAITIAELRLGLELADDRHRAGREDYLARLLERLPVISYGPELTPVHARLMAHAQRSGRPRGQHDLIIAATAAATARLLITTDRRGRFGDLPGVDVLVVPAT